MLSDFRIRSLSFCLSVEYVEENKDVMSKSGVTFLMFLTIGQNNIIVGGLACKMKALSFILSRGIGG